MKCRGVEAVEWVGNLRITRIGGRGFVLRHTRAACRCDQWTSCSLRTAGFAARFCKRPLWMRSSRCSVADRAVPPLDKAFDVHQLLNGLSNKRLLLSVSRFGQSLGGDGLHPGQQHREKVILPLPYRWVGPSLRSITRSSSRPCRRVSRRGARDARCSADT